jgi:peptidyl-prolyl cis-trans isomerase C
VRTRGRPGVAIPRAAAVIHPLPETVLRPHQKPTLPLLFAAATLVAASVPLLRHAAAADEAKPAAPAAQEAPAPAAPANTVKVAPDTVVLTIGGEKVTAAQFDDFLSGLPPQYQQMAQSDPGVRRMLADEMVKVRLLAGEARKRGLDKSDKVKTQLRMLEDQVLTQALAGDVVSDKSIQEHLASSQGSYVTARHILISTRPSGDKKALTEPEAKAKADSIRARLDKGEDFAAVAKAESDDPGSKDTGGVYTFPKGQMVKEFEETAFGLKEGELSQPVKTQFGYHVIQRQPTDLKEIRPQLQRELGPKKLDELVAELKKSNPTNLNADYFGAPPASTPALAPAPTPGPAEKK